MSKVVRRQSRWQLHGLSRFLGSESYQTTRRFVPISRPKLHRWVRLSLGTTCVKLFHGLSGEFTRFVEPRLPPRPGWARGTWWNGTTLRRVRGATPGSVAVRKKREEKKNRSRDLLQGYREQSLQTRPDLCYAIGDPEFLLFGKRSGSRGVIDAFSRHSNDSGIRTRRRDSRMACEILRSESNFTYGYIRMATSKTMSSDIRRKVLPSKRK